MNLLLVVLLAIIAIMVFGGVYFYVNIFKKLKKELVEFMQVTFEALKDRKLSVAEKDRIIKEYADIKPILKEIKDKFVIDAHGLGEELKDAYLYIKEKFKK